MDGSTLLSGIGFGEFVGVSRKIPHERQCRIFLAPTGWKQLLLEVRQGTTQVSESRTQEVMAMGLGVVSENM